MLGGRNVHAKPILNVIIMSTRASLISVFTNANAIPKLKKMKSRKKGNWCKILMGLYNVFYFFNFFSSEMVWIGFSDLKT